MCCFLLEMSGSKRFFRCFKSVLGFQTTFELRSFEILSSSSRIRRLKLENCQKHQYFRVSIFCLFFYELYCEMKLEKRNPKLKFVNSIEKKIKLPFELRSRTATTPSSCDVKQASIVTTHTTPAYKFRSVIFLFVFTNRSRKLRNCLPRCKSALHRWIMKWRRFETTARTQHGFFLNHYIFQHLLSLFRFYFAKKSF
jgi:hypothetical protein